jgi:hypothetical protein
MAQVQQRTPQSRKIENARDLQAKLYREIGISAVAAALRFTTMPDSLSPQRPTDATSPPPREDGIAA